MSIFYTKNSKCLTRSGLYLVTPTTSTFNAVGGDEVLRDGGYVYHIYRYDGTFYWTGSTSIDLLLVGGGGGGGFSNKSAFSGGGGAGGVLVYTGYTIDDTLGHHMNITIGEGGMSSQDTGSVGTNGEDTTVTKGRTFLITAFGVGGGGGGGTAYNDYPFENWCYAANDGSTASGINIQGNGGGGATETYNLCSRGTGTYDGGMPDASGAAGGGGGSTMDGVDGSVGAVGGDGGNGDNYWGLFPAGGGGASYGMNGDGIAGMYGGGDIGLSATANTGGGAGATRDAGTEYFGGSGLVVIRYLM